MRSNPGYQAGKPCVYVGMTGLDPDVRFDKHKAGIQANRFVTEFGLRLLPELYELYNPLTYDECKLKNSPLFSWSVENIIASTFIALA
jgi:hypothetical protein